jgi:putative colanic acid biosynthesis acetyltransferase WcaF
MNIDISNKPSPHSLKVKIKRVVWALVYRLAFRYTPNPMRKWRVFILRCFGAKVSPLARISPTAVITFPWNLEMEDYATLGPEAICYSTAPVFIGHMATVSQYAYLCTASHDYEDSNFTLYAKPIRIESQAWVCADAMVGPGVTVGEGAVLGAKSTAFKDLQPWKVFHGTPAVLVKERIIKRDKSGEKNQLPNQ